MGFRISLGSGATLAADLIGGEYRQIIAPVTIANTPTVNINGLTSLASGTEIRSLATILNFPATQPVTQSGTWTVQPGNTANTTPWLVTPTAGLISLASGTEIRSLATILNFPATQAVTQSGTWNIGVAGLVSLSSGTEVRSLATILNTVTVQATNLDTRDLSSASDSVAAVQSGVWNVGLNSVVTLSPSPNFIGLVTSFPAAATTYIGLVSVSGNVNLLSSPTLFAVVNTQAAAQASIVLDAGTKFIGLATVVAGSAFPITDNGGSLTVDGTVAATQSGPWNVGLTGLTSLASGTEVRSLATILNFPATQNVQQVHLTSLASGTFVSLNAGTNHIGSVSIFGNITANTGMTTLFPGPNYIGLVTSTIGNSMVTVTLGTKLDSTNDSVSVGNLISLASGTFISLNAGTNHIGSVSIFGSITANTGMTTLFPGPNQIGSVTISNIPAVTQSGTWNVGVSGLISLASGTELRSLATILNFPATQAVTQSGTWNVGLTGVVSLASGTEVRSLATILNFPATQAVSGTVTANLAAGTNSIGTATTYLVPISTYTSLSTVISASGNATLFTPPSSQRWILKDLIIGSQGQTQVGIKSGTNDVIPPIALASMGGYLSNFGDSGFRGKAVNDAFVVVNNSAVTISVTANVRFE